MPELKVSHQVEQESIDHSGHAHCSDHCRQYYKKIVPHKTSILNCEELPTSFQVILFKWVDYSQRYSVNKWYIFCHTVEGTLKTNEKYPKTTPNGEFRYLVPNPQSNELKVINATWTINVLSRNISIANPEVGPMMWGKNTLPNVQESKRLINTANTTGISCCIIDPNLDLIPWVSTILELL